MQYDAWNRLVQVRLNNVDGSQVHAAEYDGLGRRIRKTVTNSGDLDGEFSYLYNGNPIIEVRNGADDVELLVVHAEADQGGRAKGYIDEIVCQRVKDRGWAYVHQDANWNVTALTAMNGAVIERYWYKPYGEFVAAAEYGWFD